MNKNTSAFTLVELIVVATILVILVAIGFGTYQSYIVGGRDTNRIVQLKDIHDGLERMSVNTRLPTPTDMVEIKADGDTFLYQGFAGDSVIKTIGYDGGGKDTEHDTYFTYALSENKRSFQLLTFVKDPALLSFKDYSIYANVDYSPLFPKVLGSPLGVMVDKTTQNPLQIIDVIQSAGEYDIVLESRDIKAYYSDTQHVDSQRKNLMQLHPTQSCRRIKELGNSKGSGIYTIAPLGQGKTKVYCDMETDGGGWTLIARSKPLVDYGNFGWLYERGSIDDETDAYSLGSTVKDVYFESILFTTDSGLQFTQSGFDFEVLLSMSGSEAPTSKNKRIITNPNSVAEHTIPGYESWGRIDVSESYSFNTDEGDGCISGGQRCSGMNARGYSGRNNDGVRGQAGKIFIR